MSLAEDRAQVFAANRAVGRIALTAEYGRGITQRKRLHESGGLRMHFPGQRKRELEAVFINTAGGIAGGDRFDLDIAAGDKARLLVSTAAAEKVYRSLGPKARIAIKLSAAADASLAWLPKETILFDGARLRRTIEVELAEGASLVLAEALVFGRAAMGEALEHGSVFDRWRVRRGGTLVFAETMRLDGEIGAHLRERAVAAGGGGIATLLAFPADAARIAPLRDHGDWRGEAAVSTWNGFAAVRFVAADGATLRYDLTAALAGLGVALPPLWVN